ncbi:hypothetical protein LP7551_05604 [Roseibium album]|nr:hypothetical protein LP7551_05604 [Roseibium album]
MMEPRSNATIKALASLAELSANQLEEGVSIEEVIATLRKAADAVRHVVEADDEFEMDAEDDDLAQDLTPVDFSEGPAGKKSDEAIVDEGIEDEPVLNAG